MVSCDAEVADLVRRELPTGTRLVVGAAGATEVAEQASDVVVAAIPGIDGLAPTAAALRRGHHVALASKEAMVVAGPLIWSLAREHGGRITPVDSEHSALYQCLQGEQRESVASLVLTASGGPFRLEPLDLRRVTPSQALKHPNWSMGAKVTVDSATLFNKGLEVLEAHFLFELPLEQVEVLIHPQSLVHGLVRFKDGSLKAQIGPPDMRLPIQYALEDGARPATPLEPLDLLGIWEFNAPDHVRFPSLGLAYRAGQQGGLAPTYLNAADEVAVAAFLAEKIPFTAIPGLLQQALEQASNEELSWEGIRRADEHARAITEASVASERQPS